MRINVTVNGLQHCVASLDGPGFLSAHLNLSDRPKDGAITRVLRVVATETGPTETFNLAWPVAKLSLGDAVSIKLIEDGKGDSPTERKGGSERPTNLFASQEFAAELVALTRAFETDVHALLEKVRVHESPEEFKKFLGAIADVSWQVGESYLYPVYRRHSSLVPEELRGELL